MRVETDGAHSRAGPREKGDTCLNPWNISPKRTKARIVPEHFQGHRSGQRLGADCPSSPHYMASRASTRRRDSPYSHVRTTQSLRLGWEVRGRPPGSRSPWEHGPHCRSARLGQPHTACAAGLSLLQSRLCMDTHRSSHPLEAVISHSHAISVATVAGESWRSPPHAPSGPRIRTLKRVITSSQPALRDPPWPPHHQRAPATIQAVSAYTADP